MPDQEDRHLRVMNALEGDLDGIAEEGCRMLLDRLPEHAAIPADELLDSLRSSVRAGFEAVRDDRRASPAELRMFAELGAHRARYGVPLQSLVLGFRMITVHASAVAERRARELGAEPPTRARLWHWTMAALEAATEAHQRIEAGLAADDGDRRSAFLRELFAGELTGTALADAARGHGLDPNATYLAFRAPAASLLDRRALERAVMPGFAARYGDDVAGLTTRPPRSAPAGALIALGRAGPLAAAPGSFADACATLRVATALGMTGPVSIAEVPVQAAVLGSSDLTELAVERCFGEIPRAGRNREIMQDTLRVYLDHDLRVAEAAEALHVHPNTLRYRLRRFEEASGLRLERLTDLVTLWWALQYLRLGRAAEG